MTLADTTATLADDRPSGGARHVVAEAVRATRHQIERLRAAQHVLEHLLTCPRDDPTRSCPVLRAQLEDIIDTALGEPACQKNPRTRSITRSTSASDRSGKSGSDSSSA